MSDFEEAMKQAASEITHVQMDSRLTEARNKTARCIEQYARKALDRENAYRDQSTSAQAVSDAAIAYRQAERDMNDAVMAEVEVIRSLIGEGKI